MTLPDFMGEFGEVGRHNTRVFLWFWYRYRFWYWFWYR
jgi:hypothetical protein